MKKLFTALLLVTTLFASAQYGTHYGKKDPAMYFYTTLSFDVNMAFGLKELERTEKRDRGFDFDFEVGARTENFGAYLYYGAFYEFGYQNYGLGADYYLQVLRDTKFLIFDGIDFTAGAYYTLILREDGNGNWGSTASQISPRARTILWIGDFALELIAKYQGRPDIGRRVFEGQIGFTYKFDR